MNGLVKGYSEDYLFPESFRNYINGVTYEVYKTKCKRRNSLLMISKQKFQEITFDNCYLCNKMNTRYHQNGIDRKDNEMEYIVGNCLACCGQCNYLKNKFDYNKILDKCFKITLMKL